MVFTNFNLPAGETAECKNGATKTSLVVVNKLGHEIKKNTPFSARVGFLRKGNHAFVFLNEGRSENDLFIFLDAGYGVTFHTTDDKVKFSEVSTGGYGNSESTLAVLKRDVLIECHSYKNRQQSDFFRTSPEKGFVKVRHEDAIVELFDPEVKFI